MTTSAALALGAAGVIGVIALSTFLTTLWYERVYLPRIAGQDEAPADYSRWPQ